MNRSLSSAAKEILSYYVRNPGAADSLEGITRWRLLDEAIHRTLTETEESLEWLVKEGYLITMNEGHSKRLFRLNPARQKEAESALNPSTPPDQTGNPHGKRS